MTNTDHISGWKVPPYFAQILRFAIVGLCSTAIYIVVTLSLDAFFTQWPSAISAFVASCIGAVFSYSAHKTFTFSSDGRHQHEAPRFAVVTAVGFSISTLLPFVLHDVMGLALIIPVMLAATLVPAINFVALRWFVFGRATAGEAGMP